MRGGKRIGSGRKRRPETKTISFRMRLEYIEEVRKLVRDWLSSKE